MIDEAHFRRLAHMYLQAPCNRYYQPNIRIEEGVATVTIPARNEFHHAAHAVHGSVYFKALDDACFFASNSVLEGFCVLTTTFNIHLMRPIQDGVLRAEGRVVRRSRRLIFADGILFDGQNREAARGSGTFMPSEIVLNADIGYA